MKNCFVCSKELNKLNTPLFEKGITKDEKTVCTSCHREISVGLQKSNLKNEISDDLLREHKNHKELKKNKKWYDSKGLLILFFFIIPPVAIYGIFKRNSRNWKKVIFTIFGSFLSFVFLINIIYSFVDKGTVYFQNGNELFKEGEYRRAVLQFKEVDKKSKHYEEAIEQIKLSNLKLDSIKEVEETIKLKKLEILKKETNLYIKLQKKWTDSVVKDWKGAYIRKGIISKNYDTIYFQLSKDGSKGNWTNMAGIHQRMLQKNNDTLLIKRFGSNVVKRIKVILKPDPKQHARQNLIYKQFSAWDGSHLQLVRLVKQNMNNPKSFKHIETNYADKGSYISVYMKFRGSNSFGAIVINTIRAKVDLKGNILSTKSL